MTTFNFSAAYSPASVALPGAGAAILLSEGFINKVSLVAANDVSDWVRVDGPCNILCDGGTTFTVQVYRATEADKSDDVLVDTQTEADRTGFYDFRGPGYVKVILSALSAGGPVVVRITQ